MRVCIVSPIGLFSHTAIFHCGLLSGRVLEPLNIVIDVVRKCWTNRRRFLDLTEELTQISAKVEEIFTPGWGVVIPESRAVAHLIAEKYGMQAL